MHEISNDGARLQFSNFLEKDILPLMVKVAQVSSNNILTLNFEIKIFD